MIKKNIISNITLEQYNKKYRNRRYRLLKLNKNQIEDFDKKNKINNKYLLKGRKWALIEDNYYEIPKAPRLTWFRNLNGGLQFLSCLLGAGIIATAATLPFVLNSNKGSIVNEKQWIDAFEMVLDDTKERNVTLVYDGKNKSEVTVLGQTMSSSANVQATLKINNDTEYAKCHIVTNTTEEGEKIKDQDYYQKKEDNIVKEKVYTKTEESEGWDHETFEEDEDGFQSAQLNISDVKGQYNKFVFKDESYTGKITIKCDELEILGFVPEFTFKVQFKDSKLNKIDYHFEQEEERKIGEISMKVHYVIDYSISFSDYGTTTFNLPN